MNTSLTRSIGFWLLLVLSIASAAVGGWLISGQLGTMTTTLTDGTATGVEVYVGQSLIVVGSALVGAGLIGILLAVALTAAQALIPRRPAVVADPIDWAAQERADDAVSATDPAVTDADSASEASDVTVHDGADEDQNGSSGSTATATKISVK